MKDSVLIIGGPGNLSASTIQTLLERNYRVAVFSHATFFDELSSDVLTYSGERHNPNALEIAFRDFRPDVVVDFICFTPQEAGQVQKLVLGNVRQFIFISTVDIYGYPLSHLPMREDDSWQVETQSQYAADKRQCELIFKSADLARLPLTIARPAYSFGQRFLLSFTSRSYGINLLRRLRDGRPILMPGDGTTLMHVSSAYNTGRMIAALVDAPEAIGKEYTCGHHTFTTHAGYVDLFARALGVHPNMVYIPTKTILTYNDPEAGTCLLHALTRFNVAFSIERFLRDFPEFRWEVSLEKWAQHVVDWNLKHGLLDAPDCEIFDDRVIASWQKCLRGFSTV